MHIITIILHNLKNQIDINNILCIIALNIQWGYLAPEQFIAV